MHVRVTPAVSKLSREDAHDWRGETWIGIKAE